MPRWLIITVSLLAFCLLIVFSVGVVMAIRQHEAMVARESQPAGKVMDRDAFHEAVFQQSPFMVILKAGKPDRTRTWGHHEVWYYDGRVRDPISGRLGNARIRMALGRICDEVDFD